MKGLHGLAMAAAMGAMMGGGPPPPRTKPEKISKPKKDRSKVKAARKANQKRRKK